MYSLTTIRSGRSDPKILESPSVDQSVRDTSTYLSQVRMADSTSLINTVLAAEVTNLAQVETDRNAALLRLPKSSQTLPITSALLSRLSEGLDRVHAIGF